jgi:hypothetical protein
MLCGLCGLTAGFSSCALGGDSPTAGTIGMATPVSDGIAAAPQVMHDEGVVEHYVDHSRLGPPVGEVAHGVAELGIMPPGTLGQTYTRVSHPVPLDKHPRTGMLAVKDNGTVPYLSVGVMGGIKMKNGIWLFESTRPLDPGACQIVRVEARETPQDIEPYATRFVRLIPGRIVYLEF